MSDPSPRRVGLVALVVLVLLPDGSAAQPLLGPSRHFGAITIPSPEAGTWLGLSLDSFTQFDNSIGPDGAYLLVPYNAIDETIGLNFLDYSSSVQSARWPSLFYRGTLQVGYGDDNLLKAIQDRLHVWSDRRPVPRGKQRNGELDAVLAIEVDRWGRTGTAFQHFVGAGGWIGTPGHELYVHAGFSQPRWTPGGSVPFVTVGGLVRVGLPFPGDAFPDEGLSDWYRSIEGVVRLPVGRWVRRNGRGGVWHTVPDVTLGVHFDNGYFAAPDEERLGERLGSIKLAWLDGRLALEAWNDRFGGEGKDHGPTAGGQIYVRIPDVQWPLNLLP